MNTNVAKTGDKIKKAGTYIKDFCTAHSKLILSIILMLIIFLYALRQADLSYDHKFGIVLIVMGIVISLVFGLSIFLLNKERLIITYIILGLLLGLIYMFMFPIFNIPDEDTHRICAYQLSNEMMGVESSRDNVIMRKSDIDLPDDHDRYTVDKYLSHWGSIFDKCEDETLTESTSNALVEYSYPYVFSALGITIGRLTHLGPVGTVMLSRLFNMIAGVLIIALGIYFMPFGKEIMLVIALSPKLVQQDMSLSYDSCFIPLSFLVTGLGFYLIMHEREEGENKLIYILKHALWILSYVGITLIKGHAYFAFILLVFPYVRKRVKDKKRFDFIFTLLVIVLIIAAIILVPHTAFWNKTDAYIPFYQKEGFTVSYFLKHKDVFWSVIRNTVYYEFPIYCHNMLGATIGHLNTLVNPLVVDGFLLLLVASALMGKEGEGLSKFETLTVFVISLITVLCTFGGMLFSWTTIDDTMIDGVQGRYFLPILTTEMLMFTGRKIHLKNMTRTKLISSEILLQTITIYSVFGGYQ